MSTNLIGIFKKLGKLSELRTKNKNSLVESLNEVSTKADKVETSVANVEAGLNYNTIKVTKNDGTSENVLIKIQGGSGEAINVFKTAQQEGDYVAEGATDTFVIDGVDNTKDVTLIYNNLYLVEGTDYTLDKSSGTVTLTFELVADEVIHYIITSTSYEYSELNGLPDLSVYATNEKIGALETKNEELLGKVNVISNEMGYVTSAKATNFNDCVKNGKYHLYFNGDGREQNAPQNISAGENTFSIDVTQQNDEVLTQEICGIYGVNQGKKFYRVHTFGEWGEWKQVATSKDMSVLSDNFSKLGVNGLTPYYGVHPEGGGQDLNNYLGKTINTYVIHASANKPEDSTIHGWLENVYYGGEGFAPSGSHGAEEVNYQTWKDYYTSETWVRSVIVKVSDRTIISNSGWSKVGISQKKEILFPYNEGFTFQAEHIKKDIVVENNHVYVYINVKKTNGESVGAGGSIGTIPAQYRPNKEVWGTIYLVNGSATYAIVNSHGQVLIGGSMINSQYVIGCVDYYI